MTLPVPAEAAAMQAIEEVVVQGDLGKLTPAQRLSYYRRVCESVGLNPYTQPFSYLSLNGKLTLYPLKGATDQLRRINSVSVDIIAREQIGDLYVVTARATLPNGRRDEEIGAVCVAGLKGEALANALMKATTKAKRRVTLSAVGLGWLDESEVESIAGARTVQVDMDTGEVLPPEAAQTSPGRPTRPALPAPAPTAAAPATAPQNASPDEEKRARFITALSGFLCDADVLGLTPDAIGATDATPLGRLVLAAQAQNRNYHEMPLDALTTEEIQQAGRELRPIVLVAREDQGSAKTVADEAPAQEV